MLKQSVAATDLERPWRLASVAIAAWAATALSLLFTAGQDVAFNLGDSDDALRLQQVRDLLFGGQGWYDPVQHRFNPPDGVFVHWSRLIDLPLAGLNLLLRPLLGAHEAEIWMRAIWPVLTILPVMLAVAAIARRLGDHRSALIAVLFSALACSFIPLFRPGRIDHHNVQLAATLVLFACLLSNSVRAASLGGIVAGLMLAIGMETLPYIVLACAILVLRWAIFGRDRDGTVLRGFFSFFALSSLLFLMLTVAPARWLEPACDLISSVYLAPLLLGAASFASFSNRLEGGGIGPRLILVAAIGVAAIGIVAVLEPACLRGPLATIDPRLVDIWLSKVGEARSAIDLFHSNPDTMLAGFALPLAGVIAGTALLLTSTRDRRGDITVALLLVLVSFCVAIWQVRAAAFASIFAIPLLATMLVCASDALTPHSRMGLLLASAMINPLTLPLAGMGIGKALASNPASDPQAAAFCPDPRSYRRLAELKPGIVAAPVSMGSFILATSGHSVIGAPYHRNTSGILDSFALLTAPDDEAHAVARSRAIDYFVYCASSADERRADGGAAGLELRLQRGRVPAWLEPIAPDDKSPVRIFRVLR